MKRVVTIQDISCVGKCSLTVALPIISAMGVETAILPTAVLSTHTMFSGFTCKDLTDQVEPIAKHWKDEQIGFDAIYTGYLASEEQITLLKNFIADFKTENNYVIVDPAMADNGKLYPAFDVKFASKMAELCGVADVILPNVTEASFMTGMEYKESYDEAYIEEMLRALVKLGAKTAVLTGVSFEEGMTGVMGYESETDSFYYYKHPRHACSYHGTGDIFSSTFVGAMMNGYEWKDAMKIAADYTAESIYVTMKDKDGCWYGVNFESALPKLLKVLKL